MLSAQVKLTKEEKARREKNIKAGNPFVKYGCKAPVATLSKGKYLEVHDLDSIVIIGSTRWQVDKKIIVGEIKIDSLNADAQPLGDAAGIWMSPDPLSEEYPNWSPYSYTMDNPINLIDPDGRAVAKPPLRGTVIFNNFIKDVVNTNKGQIVNWSDKDGTWSYNAKSQTWVGIDESKGNNISFNSKSSDGSKHGGFAFADGGNAQDPSSLDKGGKDVQWIDFKGMLEIFALLLGADRESPVAYKVTPDTKTKNAIDAVDNAANAVKAYEAEKSKSPKMVQTVKDSKDPNKNQWVRKDVLDAQQKKKNEN